MRKTGLPKRPSYLKKNVKGLTQVRREEVPSRKKMVTFSNQIIKKHHRDAKHCILCKQHGGANTTHTTMEWCKYEKDGTSKKTFTGRSAQCNPCRRTVPCEQNNTHIQLYAKITKLEKSNNKPKRANKKFKHDHDSVSKGSNSS